MMHPAELDRCIPSIARGDREALRQLYEEMMAPVYFFALSITENKEDAKDIAQDVFLKIRAGAGSYRPGTNAKAWIFRIARNLSIDVIRKRSRTVSIDGLDEMCEVSQPDDDIFENSLAHELLAILSDEEREIVSLCIYGRLTHSDIAHALSISPIRVKWKYAYAIKKLRTYAGKDV